MRGVVDRPWKWPDRRPYTLGLVIDRVPDEAKTAIGWAVLRNRRPTVLEEGEAVTFEHSAVTAAVLKFRQMKALYPDADQSPHIVELYRYTKRSWPRSIAAAEGGTHEDHEAKIKAVAAALEREGAIVRIKTV